jgi:hypothetical protein
VLKVVKTAALNYKTHDCLTGQMRFRIEIRKNSRKDLEVYKPGSVLILSGMTIPLEPLLPAASRDLPE